MTIMTSQSALIHSPMAFYESFLSKGLRPDGRAPLEVRPSKLEKGSLTKTVASSTLRLGQTLVVCGIKAEVCVPPPTEPGLGWLVLNADLCPMADPTLRPGPPPPIAQALSETLQKLLLKCVFRDILLLNSAELSRVPMHRGAD
jgi:exosome complex component RRP43